LCVLLGTPWDVVNVVLTIPRLYFSSAIVDDSSAVLSSWICVVDIKLYYQCNNESNINNAIMSQILTMQ
jgi:hypothetical protein